MRTFFVVALGVLFSLQISTANAEVIYYGVPAPTIFTSQINKNTQDSKPLITGVTFNDTIVDVYIDGVLNGRAQVANDPSGVASFAYKPVTMLVNGKHVIYTIARSLDETVYSKNSESTTINIFHPIINVTGLTTESDPNGKIRIIGYIPNGYEVQIFIGGREFVKFIPPAATYGNITSFWYAPGLPNGDYRVGIVITSPTGAVSELVEHVLTFGSMLENDSLMTDDAAVITDSKPVIVVNDDIISHQVVITDDKSNTEKQKQVLDNLEKSDQVMIINDDNLANKKIVIDNTVTDDIIRTNRLDDGSNEAIEDVITFTDKKSTTDELDQSQESIDGGVFEEVSDNSNRNYGFGLLLFIAIVLAIWYVREKRKIDNNVQSDSNQISIEELKARLAEDKKIIIDADQSQANVEVRQNNNQNDNQQNNSNSNKNKKKKKKKIVDKIY